ncbi:hypothetical protein BD410DRAFT_547532 [Rickenella mellea]|uniref:Uncharacterized protein n=1 Tax=Rickenella mellea TaxID=50990 RepID=A0A4Y7PQZ0_9AGAM|nr:hypothetical protein BD410DRAFT_547532 [Rickenella mellea]
MLLHLVKQIFQLLDLNEYTPEKEKTFHEQCVPALCDFAASCSYYLIHPEEWFTATRVYSTLSQLTATAITADIYITTLQIGCIKLMRKFAQDDIPCSSNVNILVGTVRAFEPLIQYDDDYAVHLGSLLCACIHRLSIKLMPIIQHYSSVSRCHCINERRFYHHHLQKR